MPPPQFPPPQRVSPAAKTSSAISMLRSGVDTTRTSIPGNLISPPSPITLYPFYVSYPVCCFPLQFRQHIPARLGARVSLRPVRLLHHPHAAAAGRRRRRLLPHLHLEGREGGRGMEIGSREWNVAAKYFILLKIYRQEWTTFR